MNLYQNPLIFAIGDQLHAEITDRANTTVRRQFADEGLDEDQDMIAQIGVQAGLHIALKVCSERGWLRIEGAQ